MTTTTANNTKLSLLQATAINMIDMVGIGPFVVMPFVVAQFRDGLFIWAWIFGSITALIDGMIWSELGARFPMAGGTYNFHRIAFGEKGGRFMSFLFVWQTSIQAPLVIASAAIGFSEHLVYLVPLGEVAQKAVSALLVVLACILLYRRIETVGRISVIFGSLVILTIGWIIFSGFTHQQHTVPLLPANSHSFFSLVFWAAIGHASVKTVYSYLGYYNVCHLGGEIRNPQKNIPRSIFISIAGITVLYLLMNLSVMSVMPWQQIPADEKHLVSIFMERVYGVAAARVVTVLILCVAFSSLFAVILGYSRVPYAAAVDGNFFRIFGRLHPTRHFPNISLLFLCGLGLIFSLLFRLEKVISAILAMRIVVQFMAQCVGVVLLRKSSNKGSLPFKMWLFPVPVIISLLIWSFLLYSTGWFGVWGLVMAAIGSVVYLVVNRKRL